MVGSSNIVTPHYVEVPIVMQHFFKWANPCLRLWQKDPRLPMLSQLSAVDAMELVLFASEMHFKFVHIHPFPDGNGRIARLLVAMVLLHHHLPPIIIPQAQKWAYYRSIQQAHDEKNATKAYNFFLKFSIDAMNNCSDEIENLVKDKREL
jgi:fido (protein-threonine AMPylation protein)